MLHRRDPVWTQVHTQHERQEIEIIFDASRNQKKSKAAMPGMSDIYQKRSKNY